MIGEEDSRPVHIVAVVALVRDDGGQVLMIDSPRRGWELPGGQVEEGESLPEALVREVREETGIDIDVGRLVVVHSNVAPRAKVILGFHCRVIGGEPRCSAESMAVEWVPADQVLERIVHPAVRQRAVDLLANRDDVCYRAYSRPSGAAPGDRGTWSPLTRGIDDAK